MLSHAFTEIAKSVGLKEVHFHTLRHSFASLALSRGASPKVISAILGHSTVAFTMQTYQHIIKGMTEQAMGLLHDVLPAGKNSTLK